MGNRAPQKDENVAGLVPVLPSFQTTARIASREQYEQLYRESLDDPDSFWRRELAALRFRTPWVQACTQGFPVTRWFEGSRLNITESCLDVHVENEATRDKPALIWEAEPEDASGQAEQRTLTYAELHRDVCAFASGLATLNVRPGDRVVVYMGLVPEAVVAMLACARLGAIHSVVFGGFAADALRDRILDCGAKVVITQDGAWRRGQVLAMKATVDDAIASCPGVEHVVVFPRLGHVPVCELQSPRDHTWHDVIEGRDRSFDHHVAIVDAEHPLFLLYTSGSTGKPKGIVHTTAGYLAGTYLSTKYVFDLQPHDVFWCTADVGWITGHSYVVYGPLSNASTILLYEGALNAPDPGRVWRIIERHKVTIFYTAPTAIRSFVRTGDEWPQRADLTSLRLLGTVGEPINPDAWQWYFHTIGGSRCPIVDTWWQTETGSILLVSLPGAVPSKPGYAGLPFFGAEPAVVAASGAAPESSSGLLIFKRPWPSLARTIWGDADRFVAQYFHTVEGAYFTGDGASIDDDGYVRVIGRVDDVLNVSGHRIGTAEIESAVVSHGAVAEAAAVGRADELKGQAIVVFITLKIGQTGSDALKAELLARVSQEIGKFARPDTLIFTERLPKTRSGKIMRRFLKDIAAGRIPTGDRSTLEDKEALLALETTSMTRGSE